MWGDAMDDPERERREEALAERVSQEMIDTLVEAMIVAGHRLDFTEVYQFVGWLADLKGLQVPGPDAIVCRIERGV
jgi:hypothetical protein